MRLAFVALVLFAGPLACGGSTPPPKDPDDVPVKASSNRQGNSPATSEDSTSAAPSAGAHGDGQKATPPSLESSAPAPSGASSDTKAQADDVWMAPHQMPPGDVLKTVRPVQSKVQACYRAGLKRDPSTAGEVKIRFVITHEGQVRAWRDDTSSMSDEDVTKCVGELVNTLKFPKQKSPGDAWGVYTINFSP